MRRARWRAALTAAIVLTAAAACASSKPATHRAASVAATDWPMYGHDLQRTFAAPTTLTPATAAQLSKAWYFPTGDAVTAVPTVVGGTVYVGSWDTNFYAIDLATGRLKWKRQLDQQHAVTPYPGQQPRDSSSDGGLVTASATYEPAVGERPALVLVAGGYTLYAFVAATGRLYWKHAYTGQPGRPPNPDHDNARIFSSPAVIGNKVVIGVSVDGEADERGYIVAADIDTGKPVWTYETDVDAQGRVLNDGCGNVWSTATFLPDRGLVVFDESDCKFTDTPPTNETVFALRASDGHLVWRFRPSRDDPKCDFDFGATANAGLDPTGHTAFLGVGGKDGTYYSLDPATGKLRWSTRVVFGGFAGGFIGSTAYDGTHVYGSTALGDFGRFETNGPELCDASNPADTKFQEPTAYAFDAATGKVSWSADKSAAFAPTTVAGGMTFNGLALVSQVDVRDATTGGLIVALPVPLFSWSGVAIVGDAVILGTGSSAVGDGSGIEVFTPQGRQPAS